MDQYKDSFHKRVKPRMDHESNEYKVTPFKDAQSALGQTPFASREREQFFGEAYGEILSDLFVAWLKSEPHCVKEREYFYHTAMALGSVKEKLASIEMYGANQKFINQKASDDADGNV